MSKYRMFGSTKKQFCLANMANDVYATVRNCRCWAQLDVQEKNQRQLKSFSQDGRYEHVCMDILILLPKNEQGNQFIVVMKDQ